MALLHLSLLFFTILSPPLSSSSSDTDSTVLLRANATLESPNNTFSLGFFNPNPSLLSNFYLGIWYTSIPTRTYIWVANRHTPLKDLSSSSLSLSSSTSSLSLSDNINFLVWNTTPTITSDNPRLSLLDTGNLVLISPNGQIIWQSFDHPTDTWLPGMNITADITLTSWTSQWDPAPGRFTLRLKPPDYSQIQLVFNDSIPYWGTGDWTGSSFVDVPEMTVPYIYRFYFYHPGTLNASFGFDEVSVFPPESGVLPPLTRFHVHFSGQLRQYTWSQQTDYWNMFWARPEAQCRVYALCGPNGLCDEGSTGLCGCPVGFEPSDEFGWGSRDFSAGCKRRDHVKGNECTNGVEDSHERDGFEEVGEVGFDGATTTSFKGVASVRECEKICLGNCSCIGVLYNHNSLDCDNLFGSIVNLRNSSSDTDTNTDTTTTTTTTPMPIPMPIGTQTRARTHTHLQGLLYLRVGGIRHSHDPFKLHRILLIVIIAALVAVLAPALGLLLFMIRRAVKKRRIQEQEAALAAAHLRVFTYKELHAATRGFSEKLGHGGFGTVFRGTLSDSSHVAIKRLERPGNGGEKEFRAEVCTIGNVQHLNLVRLRGFCSENSHRMLVYDYMPNGALSAYLKNKDALNMSWDVRFRVAIGTAKALTYLHEQCRDCIIHCDIKPENILLDEDYTPKVSDFGLAKLIGRDFSRVLATMRGTWGYVAPEWISGVAITTKADVYSYGMTMLELIGGRRNVETSPAVPMPIPITSSPTATPKPNGGEGSDATGSGGGEKWFFPPWAARQIIEGKVAEVVDSRLGVAYDRGEVERLGMVAVWCIQDEEMDRPSMGMVVKMLEGVVEVGVPPPPKLLQALVDSGESFPGVDSGVDRVLTGSAGGGDAAVGICPADNNNRVSLDSLSRLPQSPAGSGNASPLATNE